MCVILAISIKGQNVRNNSQAFVMILGGVNSLRWSEAYMHQ